MNNDFDFIKQKFDESGVDAPEQLNEEFVKEQIQNVEPLQEQKSNKKFIVRISVAAAISAILINAIMIAAVFGIFKNGPIQLGNIFSLNNNGSATTASIRSFANYGEIEELLRDINIYKVSEYDGYNERVFENDLAAEEYGAEAVLGGSKGGYLNSTYIQELGVDEADTIKTDGEYIYYLDNTCSHINIFKTDNGKSRQVYTLDAPKVSGKIPNAIFSDFYIYNNKLITMISTDYSTIYNTGVFIYDISDKSKVTLSDKFIQSGKYCSSRMIDNKLYVVSSAYANNDNYIPSVSENKSTDDEASKKLDADCIYSVENPSVKSFMVVSYIDVEKSADAVKTKAILGSADEIYCNTENLYITAVENNYKQLLMNSERDNRFKRYTQIVKVKLNENLDFTASCKVNGTVNNQYSLDEHNGNVRVATTSTDNGYRDVNNLYVLDQNLKGLGKVTGFAKNESIKAVRFIGDTAYVITYMETDPLFIIDLSNPSDPEIKGSVKISGFSTMLVPVDENTLLGIGYGSTESGVSLTSLDNGVKIVTFDISDKSSPKVLDTKVYDNCSSSVQYNPKALLINFERGDYTIPLNYYKYNYDNDYTGNSFEEQFNVDSHSGVLNFRIKNGKIIETDNYVSREFGYNTGNVPVDRCLYIGDYIYMLGTSVIYDEYNDEYYDEYINDYNTYGEAEIYIDSVKYK